MGLANKLFNNLGPKGNKGKREMFSQGILCSCITPFGDLLMGCGDGTLLLCDRNLKIITTAKVSPKVRGLSPAHPPQKCIPISTERGWRYPVVLESCMRRSDVVSAGEARA